MNIWILGQQYTHAWTNTVPTKEAQNRIDCLGKMEAAMREVDKYVLSEMSKMGHRFDGWTEKDIANFNEAIYLWDDTKRACWQSWR